MVNKKYNLLSDPIDTKDSTKVDANIVNNNQNTKQEDTAVANTVTNTNNATSSIDDGSTKLTFLESTASQSSTTSFDPDIPCCSYQILPQTSQSFHSFKYPNTVIKPGNFLRKSSATTSMLLNQSSIVQNNKIGSTIKLRSSFSGAGTNGSRLKSLRRTSLTKDGRRMKKKKSLKADSSLKRKKSKVF